MDYAARRRSCAISSLGGTRTPWSARTRAPGIQVESFKDVATAVAADERIVAAGIQIVDMANEGGRDAGSHYNTSHRQR